MILKLCTLLAAAALLGACDDPEADQSMQKARESGMQAWEATKEAAGHTADAAKEAGADFRHQARETADKARAEVHEATQPPAEKKENAAP